MVVRIKAGQSSPMAMVGTAVDGTTTAIGSAERRYSPARSSRKIARAQV
jgi:hypothetical protein